jgi:hypothetical protein
MDLACAFISAGEAPRALPAFLIDFGCLVGFFTGSIHSLVYPGGTQLSQKNDTD